MRLADLLEAVQPVSIRGPIDVEVTSAVIDANAAGPDSVFVVLPPLAVSIEPGVNPDAALAVRRGCRVIISEAPDAPEDATHVQVRSALYALGVIESAFHGNPTRDMTLLAVTGTNGKTTVSWLARQLLIASGRRCGLVGTLGVAFDGPPEPNGWTTPPSWMLQPVFARMRDAGIRYVSMEATSAGLELGRLAGSDVDVGAMTNLTRDHIDEFHGTMEAYAAAKRRLFAEHARSGVFCVDDRTSARFCEEFRGPRLAVSARGNPADLQIAPAAATLQGTQLDVRCRGETHHAEVSLIGAHNMENIAVALGMVIAAGVPFAEAVQHLPVLTAPPGRLERVAASPAVFVDFAHTPDGLQQVLSAVRPLIEGRLICVFGAGGDRDRGKRPLMGNVAATLADVLVVTSDNPRTEDPDRIIADIVEGVPAGTALVTHADRREALRRALQSAEPHDTVIVAGKGHERSQQIGAELLPFDDAQVCRELLMRA